MMVPKSSRRLAARLVDWGVLQILWVPAWFQMASAYLRGDELIVSWPALVGALGIGFLYQFLFFGFLGATLGKLIFGLRVVSAHDPSQRLDWGQSLVRALADFLSFFFSLAPYTVALWRKDRTHLIDWIAESRVVQLKPREGEVKKRWFLAIVLTLYFFFSGTAGAFRFFNFVKFSEAGMWVDRSVLSPALEK